jgi:hypothetical protein
MHTTSRRSPSALTKPTKPPAVLGACEPFRPLPPLAQHPGFEGVGPADECPTDEPLQDLDFKLAEASGLVGGHIGLRNPLGTH